MCTDIWTLWLTDKLDPERSSWWKCIMLQSVNVVSYFAHGNDFSQWFQTVFSVSTLFQIEGRCGRKVPFYRLSNFSQPRFTLSIKPTTPAFMSVQNKVLFENCTHKWYASMLSRLQSRFCWPYIVSTPRNQPAKSSFHFNLYVLYKF